MNRNTLLGWALLMMVFLTWTQYKGKDAKKHLQAVEQQKADSLARAAASQPKSAGAQTVLQAKPSESTRAPSAPAAALASSPDSSLTARRLIRVETPRFTAVLDNQGARLSELRIYDLEGKPVENNVLIRPESEGALTLTLDNQSLAQTIWRVDSKDSLIRLGSQPVSIVFAAPLPKGGEVKRRYTFLPDKPVIRHEVALPEGISKYALEWNGGLEETEKISSGKGIGLNSGFFSEVVYDNGVSAQRSAFSGEKTFNAESGVLRWVGMRRKYVAVILDFHKEIQDPLHASAVEGSEASSSDPKHYRLRMAGEIDGNALGFDVVVLPLQYETIKAMGRNYEQILFSGWEWFFRADVWYVKLCGLVLRLLNLFHQWVPNYGVAIILLTLLVRFITMPLSIVQIRQTSRMAEHQPEIRKLQEKYRGDRAKMQAELMDYYRKQGINPLAPVMGCLPAFLQMPVFISLFNVLGRAVELHETPFAGWITDLSRPDVILPALQIPFLFPVGLTVLPFFMAATMWWQMKMTITDPNQKAMVWLMPIMMFVFSCSFPSGLVLYWTVSNVFTIAQTWIFKSKPKPKAVAIVSGGKQKVRA